MRARSASTQHLNPYRAGLQLGEALQDARPEVVFLFSSIHYRGDPLLLEGLHDGLASPDVLVAGCSGDGWYESAGVADVGASALALSSEGKVRWRLEAREGLGEDTVGVARGGCEALMAGGQEPTLTFLFAGRLADGSTLVDVVAGCLGGVVVGGLAGDDQRGGPTLVYAGRRVLEEGLVLLSAVGPLEFDLLMAGDPPPLGEVATVRRAAGTRLFEIGDDTALEYIRAVTGKPLSPADKGIIAFMQSPPGLPEERSLRSIASYDQETGSVILFGGVREGASVYLCHMDTAAMLAESRLLAEQVPLLKTPPVAGIVVSCAGRRWNLGSQAEHEVSMLGREGSPPFPLAGFASFGEIAPRSLGRGFTRPLFHNMTYILLLFQDAARSSCAS